MEAGIEAEFAGFQGRIENAKLVLSLCQQLEAQIMKIADEHEAIGDRGMAGRAEKLKRADAERFSKMCDEYTETCMKTLPAMLSLVEVIGGVLNGASQMAERKAAIAN